MCRHLVKTLSVTLVLAQPASALAGNDDELLVGNDAAMMGGAVSAFVDDASAAWYNPAGLGAIERDKIDVAGTVYTLRFYRVPEFLNATSGASSSASVTEFVSVPTQVAYARALVPGLTLALGYFVPQATNLVLRDRLEVDDASGHSEWQLALALARVRHNAVAAVGWSAARGLRLGVGLVGSYEAESESSVLFGAVAAQQETQAVTQFAALGTGNRIAVELALGLQLDLEPRVALGVSGRSPRLQVARSLDYALTRGDAQVLPAGDPVIIGELAQADDPADPLGWVRAGRVGVSLAYRYGERSRVCAELDFQPGLTSAQQDVGRKAVVNARLGIYQALSEVWTLGAGLFTDRSPDILDGSPVNGTGHFYGATFGFEASDEHPLAQGESADSLAFKTVFALRYAFVSGVFNSLLVDPENPTFETFSALESTLIGHELGLYVGSGLEF